MVVGSIGQLSYAEGQAGSAIRNAAEEYRNRPAHDAESARTRVYSMSLEHAATTTLSPSSRAGGSKLLRDLLKRLRANLAYHRRLFDGRRNTMSSSQTNLLNSDGMRWESIEPPNSTKRTLFIGTAKQSRACLEEGRN